ncbi:MAG: ROK family protein [Chloroflexota bacterium]|nr:ROK family protein [Chloroflexota bacterium]
MNPLSCYNHHMNVTIVLDIGGTHMRVAAFPEKETTPTYHKRIRTYTKGETSIERLINLIHGAIPPGQRVDAVGIAVPGPVDPEKGIILTAPNLPEWESVPIPQRIEAEIGAPAFLGNDANLAALGEWRYGAGRGHHDLIYLTVSTGIGGGVISNDHLLLGSHGLAAELGHVTILPDGPLCGCGQRGHLEALASGTGIAAYVADQLEKGRKSSLSGKPNAKEISQAAKNGDMLANEAFQRAGHYLGLGVANYLVIFNPSIVIFGGGVSKAGDSLFKPMRETIQKTALSKHYLADLVITTAELDDNAGLYGALALARDSNV